MTFSRIRSAFSRCSVALMVSLLVTSTSNIQAASPAPAFLVKAASSFTEGPPQFLRATGNTLYFRSGNTIWESDGTGVGTKPTDFGLSLGNPSAPIQVGNKLIEVAQGSQNNLIRLYRYDPTVPSSTPISLDLASYSQLGVVNGVLLFLVSTSGRTEVWKSDGTSAGTGSVAVVNPSASVITSDVLTVGTTIFFSIDDGIHGYDLWKTDGTAAGTRLVKDVSPPSATAVPQTFTALGSRLFFIASDGVTGRELWISDGTEAGTTLVKDISVGSADSGMGALASDGRYVFFFMPFGSSVTAGLWKSDGTDAGTTLVKAMTVFRLGEGKMAIGGSHFYFTKQDTQSTPVLWTSDGTEAGTHYVNEANPQAGGIEPLGFRSIDDSLVYNATGGGLVWRSRGSAQNTGRVADVSTGIGNGTTRDYTAVGDLVFFTAETGTGPITGSELWAMPRSLFRSPKVYLPLAQR